MKFDLSEGNQWGRAVNAIGPNANGWRVAGCLTPLPKNGDELVANNGTLWVISNVEYWGDPRDGFAADVTPKQQDKHGDAA